MTETIRSRGRDREVWLRRGCALIVAAVAAYGSYEHQRDFALHGGADPVSAAMWPLSVDGLLLLATVGLLKSGQQASRRVRLAVWLSFLLGIAVSLAANIAAAPTLAWQPVLVAAGHPLRCCSQPNCSPTTLPGRENRPRPNRPHSRRCQTARPVTRPNTP